MDRKSVNMTNNNPTKSMTLTYVVSLSIIAILSILVHFMLDRIINEQSDSASIVNISGKQRMLSQRVSLFTMEYLSTGHSKSQQEAQQALNQINHNHQFLLNYHTNSEDLRQLYYHPPHEVNDKLATFSQLITEALNTKLPDVVEETSDKNLQFLELAKHSLLNSLDTVVAQHETDSIQKVEELRFAQQMVSVIIILTLLIEALFIFRPMVSKVSRFAERLQKEANHDPLTGLLNRRSFSLLLDKALALSRRHNHKLSLVTFDIDHFKSVNDNYGHDVGDKTLQHISSIIKSNTRVSDSVARFGGEEFVMLLPQTKQQDAFYLANKIREKIENSPLSLDGIILEITVSAGVSEFQTLDEGMEDALKRSDDSLYQAKSTGRNKVCQT